jgi:predicted ATPase/DNA-binding CsgD family transcriptional regulator
MAARGVAMPAGRDAPAGNLPPQPTALIGRADELATARGQVLAPGVRLLTLTGPGGVGKTRLAVAVATSLQDDPAFPDGVRFVDLAPLPEPAVVPSASVRALGLLQAEGRTAMDALEGALASRRLLLVLDNFEHLLGAAAEVGRLLGACPGVVVLATSREPLRLRWERTLPLGPLAVPDPNHLPPLAELAAVPAVALFLERARAGSPAFALTPGNAAAVAALCYRLDGLPLAIELVAARAALLGPAALLDRLGRQLPLPASAMQDAPTRHRTLRATIQWSYDLLDPAEQALFRRVAAFAGGWTLEAAEAVAGPAGGEPDVPDVPDVLGGLTSLADKSLVQVDAGAGGVGGEPRFRMLETAREVALDLLAAAGETEAIRRRHAAYYAALAERAEPQLQGPEQAVWFARLEREQGNFRQALRWALDRGDAEALEQGLRLAGALGWFWFLHGYPAEAREWLTALLRPAAAAAQTDGSAGDAGRIAGVPAAVRARALNAAGFRAIDRGEYDLAVTFHQEALAAWGELGDTRGRAAALHGLADASLWRGDAETARARYEEGLALARAAGTADEEALFLYHLGQLWWLQGDLPQAQDYAARALAAAKAAASSTWTAYSLFVLASVAHERGEPARAGSLYREAVALAGATGDRLCLRMVLPGLAGLVAAQGDAVRALTLAGAAAALQDQAGVVAFPPIRERQERWLAPAREALDDQARGAAWAQGQAMDVDRVVTYALEESAASRAPAAADRGGPSAGPLSPREREVLALVAEGRSNREIAAALIVTENTAKYHVAQLLNKLGASSRAEAVARAVAAGLLTPRAD